MDVFPESWTPRNISKLQSCMESCISTTMRILARFAEARNSWTLLFPKLTVTSLLDIQLAKQSLTGGQLFSYSKPSLISLHSPCTASESPPRIQIRLFNPSSFLLFLASHLKPGSMNYSTGALQDDAGYFILSGVYNMAPSPSSSPGMI